MNRGTDGPDRCLIPQPNDLVPVCCRVCCVAGFGPRLRDWARYYSAPAGRRPPPVLADRLPDDGPAGHGRRMKRDENLGIFQD